MSEGRFIVGTGLRGKVERLLKGEIRVGDLHDLIFDMRDEGGGSGVVSEVGNFIAHPLVRTQGIVWREVNDAVAFLRFRMSFDSSGKLVTYTISSSVPNLLRANLRRIRKPSNQSHSSRGNSRARTWPPHSDQRGSSKQIKRSNPRRIQRCLVPQLEAAQYSRIQTCLKISGEPFKEDVS